VDDGVGRDLVDREDGIVDAIRDPAVDEVGDVVAHLPQVDGPEANASQVLSHRGQDVHAAQGATIPRSAETE